ncbi:MAG TPA: nucleotidyltransferase family protein [Terriglobales bacterium]|jgi:NDP-sugar pyrophosphorylase family protein|nr:nucleotidyltransferase family protein [Terriglobales bacterium]
MRAMVLAAGLGTRLRPLTNDRPKALVEVAGRTLLEITFSRLRSFGVEDVIVNVHHFADMVVDYLQSHRNFGMHVEISQEDVLLDTGGGLKKAAWFFQDSQEPFFLHNVDVISTIDLSRMVEFHKSRGALATLAVQNRETSRHLLFDEAGELCGRRAGRDGAIERAREAKNYEARAFSGIHVISPRLLQMLDEEGAFSIVSAYLRLARGGEEIAAFSADDYYWRDLGKVESVKRAEQELGGGVSF